MSAGERARARARTRARVRRVRPGISRHSSLRRDALASARRLHDRCVRRPADVHAVARSPRRGAFAIGGPSAGAGGGHRWRAARASAHPASPWLRPSARRNGDRVLASNATVPDASRSNGCAAYPCLAYNRRYSGRNARPRRSYCFTCRSSCRHSASVGSRANTRTCPKVIAAYPRRVSTRCARPRSLT